ncbi:MAG: HlyD family efflux transporter periplasmic adaptor subunit [Anaerovoracaceae bacterium]|jgi:multidrug resistance efflux pump
MKPIIVDMKDMGDSKEVYESRPAKAVVYTIYVILAIILVALIWMTVYKVDVVAKGNGIFRSSQDANDISCKVTGSIEKCYVDDGEHVDKGDVLYLLNVDALSDTISTYQEQLNQYNDRMDMLDAYAASLDGDESILDAYSDNPYYQEFVNRRNLLFANIKAESDNMSGQTSVYEGTIADLNDSISQYQTKIDKLSQAENCVTSRKNTFSSSDSYYYSIVSSYLSSWNYTSAQYDNKISDYQKQLDAYRTQLSQAGQDSASISQQISDLNSTISSAQSEKSKALSDLELQEITSLEQQIETCRESINSLKSNVSSSDLQLQALNPDTEETKRQISILTEKGNIATEKLNCQQQIDECSAQLDGYEIQDDNCKLKASSSGYYYAADEYKTGQYIQQGTTIGSIYPEKESKYYAELYVDNSDIAKIKVGQKVKFEIAAYPSSEYGYFTGKVDNISKDITVDQNSGGAYYVVRVKCDDMTVKNSEGQTGSLKNGMACQGKIIVDRKSVLRYVLEKIDLLD